MTVADPNETSRAILRSRLTDKQADRIARVHALDEVHVGTDRDDDFQTELELVLAHMLNKNVSEGYAVAVTGPSGAGKTTLVNRRLEAMDAFRPFDDGYGNQVQFVLKVKTPSACNAKTLGKAILLASGYPLEKTPTEDDIWITVRQRLRRCMHKVIFFDEFQHVLKSPKAKGAAHLTNTIKLLMQDPEWPVWLIVAGVPDILEIIEREAWYQLDRRVRGVAIDDLKNDEFEIRNTRNIIDELARAAKLEVAFPMTDDFITRLMHGGLWRFGMTVQLIKMSIESALFDKDGNDELTYEHFERGYSRLTRTSDDISNVFVADNWDRIERQVNHKGKLSSKYHLLAD